LGKWWNRKDLFDYVVMKSVEFIIGFINQVWWTKTPILAALFIKRPDIINQVLEKIKYNDDDLEGLTFHRPELAESHDQFFKVMGRINAPEYQEAAVAYGVFILFDAKKHVSVISLIDALGKRQFNGRNVAECCDSHDI
jgi:hypothetical protein